MVRPIFATVIALVGLGGGVVVADEVGAAMKAFGLVGTWSVDCSADIKQRCTDALHCYGRLTFSAPAVGKASEEVVSRPIGNYTPASTSIAFDSATQATNDKLKMTYTVTNEAPNLTGRFVYVLPMKGEEWDVVYQRIGERLRTWEAQRTDGLKIRVRNGHPTIPGGGWNADQPGPVSVWSEKPEDVPLLEKCIN